MDTAGCFDDSCGYWQITVVLGCVLLCFVSYNVLSWNDVMCLS